MIELSSLDVARFWMKTRLDKNSPIIRTGTHYFGHCWIWKGHLRNGYGIFSLHQKSYRAHRLAYYICYGEIPDKMLVCHKCDNPICVNPEHLFIGSSKENTLDMIIKGRTNRTRCKHIDSLSKYPGISFRNDNKKWRARIMRNYQTIWCAEFSSEEEAHKARTQKMEELAIFS